MDNEERDDEAHNDRGPSLLLVAFFCGAGFLFVTAIRSRIVPHLYASPHQLYLLRINHLFPLWFCSQLISILLCSASGIASIAAIASVIAFRAKMLRRPANVMAAIACASLVLNLVFQHYFPQDGPFFRRTAFPDRHATFAIAFYGFLAVATFPYLPARWAKIVLSLVTIIVLNTVVSDLYFGYVWPIDIVGALLCGLAIACIAISLYNKGSFGGPTVIDGSVNG